jgi:hypothetical protein
MSDLNVGKLLWEGARRLIEEGNAEDAKKQGVLRAGNAGMMGEDEETGQLIAVGGSPNACPRRTFLRFQGLKQEAVDDRRIHVERMFDQGRASEAFFRKRLEAALPKEYKVLAEEEIAVKWTTSSGVDVTGRPDNVIVKVSDNSPVIGIENKCLSSLWTATSTVFKGEPKTDHLIQAAHYSWQLGKIPFELWYSSGSVYALPNHFKYLPQKGELRSELLGFYEGDNPKANSVVTPEVGYKLRFDAEGYIEYRQVSYKGGEDWSDEWTRSIVSIDRIRNFYEFVASMQSSGLIGPRPDSIVANGKSEGSYSPCKYCELSSICDKHEGKGLNKWIKEVIKFLSVDNGVR